mgnify:CR=1 FL=1
MWLNVAPLMVEFKTQEELEKFVDALEKLCAETSAGDAFYLKYEVEN